MSFIHGGLKCNPFLFLHYARGGQGAYIYGGETQGRQAADKDMINLISAL